MLTLAPKLQPRTLSQGLLKHLARAQVDADSLGQVIKALGDAGVRTLISQPPTLEELFLRHYDISADTTAETSEGVPA